MKILILGTSGKCGQWVTRYARERGHEITSIVRAQSMQKLKNTDGVIKGEVLDEGLLTSAAEGQHAVISTLGLNRAGPLPWARLESPPDLVQRVMATLASVCTQPDSPRLVWLSAGGVGQSKQSASLPVRTLIRMGNVGVAFRDLEAAERIMGQAQAESVPVRPVTLLNGESSRRAAPISRYTMFSTVRRSAVARWMLDVADGTCKLDTNPMLLGTV